MTYRRPLFRALVVLLAAHPLVAVPFGYPEPATQLAQAIGAEGRGMSLDEAVSRARRQSGDKVLSAETVRVNGRRVHRIKILTTDGRVKRVQFDADTGQAAPRRR